ncbi:MAG: histidinol-phosphate transaminase [Gemmatimonadota bacterium]
MRSEALETAAPPTPSRPDLERIWPYIPGLHRTEIEREFGVRDVLKLASNENPLGPSPRALAALERLGPEAHRYPDSQALVLREALAARHGVDLEQIVVGNGSVECIDLVARAFLRPGDEAVVGFPSFPRFQIACQIVGVQPTVVPHVDWAFDLDGLRAVVSERTRVVFLDDPCNPTGTRIGPSDLAALLDDLPPDTLVLLDRAYYEFVTPEDRFEEDVERIRGGANLIVLRTFSKAYGLAGLRVGYAVARAEHARALDRVREAFNTSVFAQAAALAALGDDEHVAATVRLVEKERDWLRGRLDRLGLAVVRSATNFLFTDLGPGAASIDRELLRRGIIVRPMSAPGIKTRARISIPARPGGERLVAALEEILA